MAPPAAVADPTAAKAKLITDYLLLAQQMTTTATSMTQYVTALAASPTHGDTLTRLVPIPEMPNIAGPFKEAMEAYGNHEKPSKRKSKREDEEKPADSDEGDKKTKRKRKEGPVKVKDPNAPKRPMSAFLVWSNANRLRVKDLYPELSYQDLTKKLGELWKDIDQAEKDEISKQAAVSMKEWKDADALYKTQNAGANGEAAPKSETKEKAPKKEKAAKEAAPKAKSIPVAAPVAEESENEEGSDSSDEDSEAQAPVAKKAKVSKVQAEDSSEESDEESENSPAPVKKPTSKTSPSKSAPASTSKPAKKSKSDKK